MSKQDIQTDLEVIVRNANMISDKLSNADLNITEQRRLSQSVKKAKKILGEAEVIM